MCYKKNKVDNLQDDLFAFKINYNDATTATKLYNGNISETYWKTSTDNKKRKYDYKYDDLNRLLQADYSKQANTTFNSYLEHLSYDKNGNIQTLKRNGGMDSDGFQLVNPIDNLTYLYDTDNQNQLLRVFDETANPQGFKDDNNGTSLITEKAQAPDYGYDANGNITKDDNKGIQSIIYNHLNLPTKITFANGNFITYLYNAVGQKVNKTVQQSADFIIDKTDYLAGFQYFNEILRFFPHAEGYVNATKNKFDYDFDYVFNYTDHLGNIRLSYSKDINTNALKVIEENHYYPFGLKHTGYNSDVMLYVLEVAPLFKGQPELFARKLKPKQSVDLPANNYKFNNREWQDELGLNWTSMDCRNYDPAIGRFNVMDPLTELAPMHNPYRFGYNNPVYWKDPSGLIEFEYDKNGKATSFKTSNKDEIAAIMGFLNKNEGASAADIHTFVFEDMQNENSVFAFDLQEVVVEGKSKKSESSTLDNANFFNDRIGDGADILGATNNRGGSFRLTNNGSYNPRNLSPKYYGSNWTGGSRAGIKTYNISKVIKNGSIATTVVLGTIEVGQGVADDYENYQTTGYTNGKNTAVASAKVAGGVGGAWAGAKGGAAVGAAIGVWFGGVGAAPGAVIGGIIGGAVGGWAGSEIGGAAVEKAYE